MMIRRLFAAMALLAFVGMPAFAETATTTPAPKAAPKAAPKQAPVTAKVNLNTANAEELDKLPQIGPARAKAIVDARAKGPFKNWDDFVARKVVPANAQRAIKDLVIF
jgi:competence protein ComEA